MHQLMTSRLSRLGLGFAAAALGAMALASGAAARPGHPRSASHARRAHMASASSARPVSPTGAFVIGDQSADTSLTFGSQITFWGAQWWKDNSLSGGLAPASFKGFADTATPMCGEEWTTRPGNSSEPPLTVDTTAPVEMVVSTNVTKSGPVISGDTEKVVLVQINPGYGPNPGHPGTGTVVGVVCDVNGGVT